MDGDESDTLLVFTNLPDREAALELAHGLVERRLAACVNVLDRCTSVYRWKGEIEEADEVPVLVKTRTARYEELEAAIRELHPYELPKSWQSQWCAGCRLSRLGGRRNRHPDR